MAADFETDAWNGRALLTDLYQLTMAQGYWKTGRAGREAVFHLFFRKAPFQSGFTIAAGLATAVDFLKAFHFTKADLSFLATLTGNDDQPLFAPGFLDYVASLRFTCDVDAIHQGYVRAIETALGRKLDWQRDDLALQNIQARVRSPGIWLLANLNNALLLATSNRSEAAVGCATMDGDTSGGLSPIAGIDKAFLRQWLRRLEITGPADKTTPLPINPCRTPINIPAPPSRWTAWSSALTAAN
jgi:NH3-dependent NAD+ synthetase